MEMISFEFQAEQREQPGLQQGKLPFVHFRKCCRMLEAFRLEADSTDFDKIFNSRCHYAEQRRRSAYLYEQAARLAKTLVAEVSIHPRLVIERLIRSFENIVAKGARSRRWIFRPGTSLVWAEQRMWHSSTA